jgi:hypothetical protein
VRATVTYTKGPNTGSAFAPTADGKTYLRQGCGYAGRTHWWWPPPQPGEKCLCGEKVWK